MADRFLGEVRLFGFGHAPNGWARCDGQLMNINQNQALFSLLGTTYGGNGFTQFALPDLRSRVPIHRGAIIQGRRGGSTSVTLGLGNLPAHNHFFLADDSPPANPGGQNPTPGRRLARSEPGELYGSAANLVAFSPVATTPVGGGQAHTNLQPSLTVSFCIALIGIFPSRN